MDDHKVEAVVNWPILNSVKDLQKFLGFAIFYHSRSPDSSPKRNSKETNLDPAAETAFQNLKTAFS